MNKGTGVEIIAKAANKKVLVIVDEIVAAIQGPVADDVDGFFRRVASYVGKEVDLRSQTNIDGLEPWKELSLPYIRAKGRTAWFLSTPYNPALHRSARRASEPVLRDNLLALRGSSVFGPIKAEVTDWSGSLVRRTVGKQVMKLTGKPPPSAQEIKFLIMLQPFGDLKRSDLMNIESWLLDHGLSPLDRAKLINRAGSQRPLIRPLLAHMVSNKLPEVIAHSLKTAFPHLLITVRVVTPLE